MRIVVSDTLVIEEPVRGRFRRLWRRIRRKALNERILYFLTAQLSEGMTAHIMYDEHGIRPHFKGVGSVYAPSLTRWRLA